jgi:hypothetical protein
MRVAEQTSGSMASESWIKINKGGKSAQKVTGDSLYTFL